MDGVLHHPAYREKFAENLKRELPRIPFIGTVGGRGLPRPPRMSPLKPPRARQAVPLQALPAPSGPFRAPAKNWPNFTSTTRASIPIR